MSADRYLEWVAAYVLGALSPDERHEFEEHLTACATCAAAVTELTGLPGVLGRLDLDTAMAIRDQPEHEETATTAWPAESVVLLAARVRRGRIRRRWTTGLGLAAALVLGAGISDGLPQPFAPASRAETLHAVARSGLTAQLQAATVSWGTRLTWSCNYPSHIATGTSPRPYETMQYQLVVTTKQDTQETVATWTSSRSDAKNLSAATRIPTSDIRRIDIRVLGSKTPLAEAEL